MADAPASMRMTHKQAEAIILKGDRVLTAEEFVESYLNINTSRGMKQKRQDILQGKYWDYLILDSRRNIKKSDRREQAEYEAKMKKSLAKLSPLDRIADANKFGGQVTDLQKKINAEQNRNAANAFPIVKRFTSNQAEEAAAYEQEILEQRRRWKRDNPHPLQPFVDQRRTQIAAAGLNALGERFKQTPEGLRRMVDQETAKRASSANRAASRGIASRPLPGVGPGGVPSLATAQGLQAGQPAGPPPVALPPAGAAGGPPTPQVAAQTAINPETGERLILDPRTGQWRPIQQQ